LLEPTGGRILVRGEDITDHGAERMLPYRRQMQMIYRDPYASLNPRMSAGEIVGEPLTIAHGGDKSDRVAALFERVGLRRELMGSYPHEFSGGRRQRIGIARALALSPERRVILKGDVPSPINPPAGCHFHTRCLYAAPRCREEAPALREVVPGHWASCHLHDAGVKFPLGQPVV
jgi:ABC-type oligopeptide transport system ATPase subunit